MTDQTNDEDVAEDDSGLADEVLEPEEPEEAPEG
jgi:hypothetical protein